MPTYKTPQRFPGVDRLPDLARTLIERAFPPDELPTPAIAKFPKYYGIETLKRVRTLPTLSGLGPNNVTALTLLQQKYPRMFAHVADVEPVSQKSAPMFATRMGEMESFGPSSVMRLRPENTLDEALLTSAHELTHGAQNLRSGGLFNLLYDRMQDAVGYAKNPFERRAEVAGKNFLNRVRSPKTRSK